MNKFVVKILNCNWLTIKNLDEVELELDELMFGWSFLIKNEFFSMDEKLFANDNLYLNDYLSMDEFWLNKK